MKKSKDHLVLSVRGTWGPGVCSGTFYVKADVWRRSRDDDGAERLVGLTSFEPHAELNGLMISAHVYRGRFIGCEPGYSQTFWADERELRSQLRALSRLNRSLTKMAERRGYAKTLAEHLARFAEALGVAEVVFWGVFPPAVDWLVPHDWKGSEVRTFPLGEARDILDRLEPGWVELATAAAAHSSEVV